MEESQLNLQIMDIWSIAPERINNSDTPLLYMIKNVINVRKSNLETMILTNSQILDILNIEYNMNTNNLSQFEIDIHVNILKKYLKLWPNWELLDEEICKDNSNFEQNLNNAYENLKEYLLQTLKEAKEAMKHLQKNVAASLNNKDDNCPEVVLGISCTRHQLNNIILRKPTPTGNIFNIINPIAKAEEYFNAVEIINWPMVKILLQLPGIELSRTNSMEACMERNLLNIKRLENSIVKDMMHPLNSNHIYFKESESHTTINSTTLSKDLMLDLLKKMISREGWIKNKIDRQVFVWIMTEFVRDFAKAPNVVKSGDYRIYLHKYKYIRRLCVEMNNDTEDTTQVDQEDICDLNNYDLQLQELFTPQVEFCLNKLSIHDKDAVVAFYKKDGIYVLSDCFKKQLNSNKGWLKIKCIMCNQKFNLPLQYDVLLDHFHRKHHSELDWECTGCHKTFNMKTLARNRWSHNCLPSD